MPCHSLGFGTEHKIRQKCRIRYRKRCWEGHEKKEQKKPWFHMAGFL